MEHPLVDRQEERYYELTEKIQNQEAKIAKLTAQIEAFGAQKPALPSTLTKAKLTALPAAKKMNPELNVGDADPLAPLQENTVASSKHEDMHFYFEGLRLLEEQKFDLALASFRDFLKSNPVHVYADRAQFQIAEAHFLNKDYGLVVVATNLMESRYPYSFKLPEALYKRAVSFANLGQSESAQKSLRDLLNRFPDSSTAKLATLKLAELGGQPSTAPPLLE